MNKRNKILIEGVSSEEILEIIDDPEFEQGIISNEPLVFNIGSAEVLAQFGILNDEIIVDLVHITGGGEGVLLIIRNLVKSYCKQREISTINWQIHATNCVNPNPKLKRILELRNYQIKNVANRGNVYCKKEKLI